MIKIFRNVIIVLTSVELILSLGSILKYTNYGIDFTDEGFYLTSISNPFLYKSSFTLFGFIYHPIYILFNGNITLLRQANILITFSIAYVLAYVFMTRLLPEVKNKLIVLNTICLGLAISSLASFNSWLITPSYNSLALQSLLIAGIGLLLAEKDTSRRSFFGWALIGISGWLAFMAKPSTALALAIATPIYLIFSQKFSIRLLLLSLTIAFGLLLISALLIDGSIFDFIQRLKLGIEFAGLLGGGHRLTGMLRVDRFQLSKSIIFSSLIFFSITYIAAWSSQHLKRGYFVIYAPIALGLLAITLLLLANKIHFGSTFDQFQGLIIFSIIFSIIFTGIGYAPSLNTVKKITRPERATACLFAFMPYIYAFGTSNNYWIAGSSAGIFWLLASLFVLAPMLRSSNNLDPLILFIIGTQTVIAILLQNGEEHPYRQPQPLRLNSSLVEIRSRQSALTLSDGYAEYISKAYRSAQIAQFRNSTPVIDLSGQSPGLLYILGAENLGQAWMIGGYAGSQKVAEATLALVSCEKIANAWVLYEKDGPLSISTELMIKLGANFPKEYKKVGSWQTAQGAGGFLYSRLQELYEPIMPNKTFETCRILRGHS